MTGPPQIPPSPTPPPGPEPLPALLSRRKARRLGHTDRQITYRVASGRWTSVRRGFLAPGGEDDDRPIALSTLAAVSAQRRSVVISHLHAARLHGLPAPLGGWGVLVLTATSGATRTAGALRVLVAPLHDDEVVRDGRLAVTAPARTVVDCLRTLPERDGLAVLDAALHRGLVGMADLEQALRRCQGWPGAPRARRVASVADGRRESALESWSAWAFHVEGLRQPTWQADVRDRSGRWLGRVDGWWHEGVAGEADGRAKYRLAAAERGGVTAKGLTAVLDQERRREQGLRRAGAALVRWGAADVLDPRRAAELVLHLRRELVRAERNGGFDGSVHDTGR